MRRALTVARTLAGSLAFRALTTLALMALVSSRIDWGSVSDKVSSGEPGYGVLAVLAVAAALVIGGLRWALLLQVADVRLPRRELFRIYAVTSFANAFLPTTVGGDVARPLMVSRRGPLLVRAIVTVVAERVAALIALILLAWLGVATASGATSGGAVGALVVVSTGLVAFALVLALRPAVLHRVGRALVPARLSGQMAEAVAAARALAAAPRALIGIGLLSLVFQALVTLQLVLLAKMIGVQLSLGLAAVALALVTLATLLPISIGGFGVREGSYVAVLAGGGIGHTDAVLISLLTVVALFFATLPGALELVRDGFSPAITEAKP
jgi:uncharacterized protein (TIRG00374 family)